VLGLATEKPPYVAELSTAYVQSYSSQTVQVDGGHIPIQAQKRSFEALLATCIGLENLQVCDQRIHRQIIDKTCGFRQRMTAKKPSRLI